MHRRRGEWPRMSGGKAPPRISHQGPAEPCFRIDFGRPHDPGAPHRCRSIRDRSPRVVCRSFESRATHRARSRSRRAGGHDIPEEMIRSRWDASRRNIIALMPHMTELRLFDNSTEIEPYGAAIPEPRLLMQWNRGRIVTPAANELWNTPEWAKPIVAAALKLQRSPR